MAKLTTSDVGNLTNETAFISTINSNNAIVEAAFENTLSRDGTAPNTMLADFDMNSHKILNLPDALSDQEPVTFGQFNETIEALENGAVLAASYVTLSPSATLTNERVLTAGSNVSITDGGAGGNVTVAVSDAELNALASTTSAADKVPYFTGAGTASTSTLTAFGRSLIDDVDATTALTTLGAQPLDATLTSLAAYNSNGLFTQTAPDTFTSRAVIAPAAGITVTNGDGVAGHPTLALANDLSALEGLAGTGLAARTGTDTWAQRTLTAPAAGITVSNGGGVAGNPTLALADDLNALESLATTGIARRTGTSTWTASNAVTNAELNTMNAFTFKGNNTSGAATPTDVDIALLTTKATPAAGDYAIISDQAASGAWKKATVSSLATSSGVSSIAGNTGAFTLGTGLTNAVNDIRTSLTTASNILGGNVTPLSNTIYNDGPSMAQGTSGTWFVTGAIVIAGTTTTGDDIAVKLWDGTTVISSSSFTVSVGNFKHTVHLSGILASPAGNIRISAKNLTTNSGSIIFNGSGNSKDSYVWGVRIA
jgi:hypothetical protein